MICRGPGAAPAVGASQWMLLPEGVLQPGAYRPLSQGLHCYGSSRPPPLHTHTAG